jgi:hypothetical protein
MAYLLYLGFFGAGTTDKASTRDRHSPWFWAILEMLSHVSLFAIDGREDTFLSTISNEYFLLFRK